MHITGETLNEPVIERARKDPDRLALVFIDEDGTTEHVTTGQIHAESVAFAQALQQLNIGPKDLVVLVLRHSRVLLSAFWGALYLGAIPAIFPFLTPKLDPGLYFERVRKLVEFEGVRAVITFPEFKQELTALLAGIGCEVLSTDEVAAAEEEAAAEADSSLFWKDPSGENIALLQHSSGTTGLHKGVALSHGAVVRYINSYNKSLKITPDDVFVSWLPLYHDMGLIGGFVMPMVSGVPLVLMSPFHWVRDPKILLQAIDKYRGTICWVPNFSLNHSVRTIRERDLQGLDLSSWRVLIDTSETVRLDSIEMFLERFGPYGLREETITAAYGMAENVFVISQTPVGQRAPVDWVNIEALQKDGRAVPVEPGSPGSTPVMGCGLPIDGVEIAVVDEKGQHLPERRVGEFIIRSEFMLTEYYERPDITAEAIRDGWYYSSDIGYLAGGQVYVSGRKKDMIIVGGKNIFPQDLEAIANVTPGIHPGRAVAFGVTDERMGTESIVMVCELTNKATPEEYQAIERDLRARVARETEVTLGDLRLVDKRWVIKTSSGKHARPDNRAKYLKEFHGIE
jgi:fatty-acyl-CoA synthase